MRSLCHVLNEVQHTCGLVTHDIMFMTSCHVMLLGTESRHDIHHFLNESLITSHCDDVIAA